GLVDGVDTRAVVSCGERTHFPQDLAIGAARRLPCRGEIDVGQESAGGGGEQRQEQKGQPERRGAEDARQPHAHVATAPTTASRSPSPCGARSSHVQNAPSVSALRADPPPPLRGGGSGRKMLHREAGELSAKLTEGAFRPRAIALPCGEKK